MEKIAIIIAASPTLFLKPFLSMNTPAGMAIMTKTRGHTKERREMLKALTPNIFDASEDMGAKVSHKSWERSATSMKAAKTTHLYGGNSSLSLLLTILIPHVLPFLITMLRGLKMMRNVENNTNFASNFYLDYNFI